MNRNDQSQYRQWIIEAATRYQVPVDLALAIAQRESGIRQYDAQGNVLRSKEDAFGVMQVQGDQFGDGTRTIAGARYNVMMPYDNIQAGMHYLSLMHQRFPDWSVAAAAYNDGPGNVAAWIVGRRPLPRETIIYALGVTARAGITDAGVAYSAGRWPRSGRATGPLEASAGTRGPRPAYNARSGPPAGQGGALSSGPRPAAVVVAAVLVAAAFWVLS